jgi:hypothetical protein
VVAIAIPPVVVGLPARGLSECLQSSLSLWERVRVRAILAVNYLGRRQAFPLIPTFSPRRKGF